MHTFLTILAIVGFLAIAAVIYIVVAISDSDFWR